MKTRLKAVVGNRAASREDTLRFEGLSKGFHTAGGYLPVLEDVSFRAEGGELIAILGRSGCGKSTLLKIAAGFISPSSGRVLLNGEPVEGCRLSQ
ncbi:ATP-binding cassette domain-containing protein [Desulfatiglans anilini]|uniref:ATP-binding cassette domain-containing protein n=1 Tax=Desulfatiglans anilini TaxID=90728 RepID=UPI00041BDB99|nr:ATP-binding cassette domain-containing protein [Desulfatiglans anilini]